MAISFELKRVPTSFDNTVANSSMLLYSTSDEHPAPRSALVNSHRRRCEFIVCEELLWESRDRSTTFAVRSPESVSLCVCGRDGLAPRKSWYTGQGCKIPGGLEERQSEAAGGMADDVILRAAENGDWRAALWWLERRRPAFSRTIVELKQRIMETDEALLA